MRKSSVYLPDDLKGDLAALAARWGRSEAELIRLAIERLVHTSAEDAAPAPTVDVPKGPRLVGVGIGPSDPDLVTQRALTVLRAADRVYAASTSSDAISRAETVVRASAPEVRVDRLVIEIGGDEGARHRSIVEGADQLIESLDRGELVAMVVLGDPNVYSVFSRMARHVRNERALVPIDVVPGIMGFQALAAQTGTTVVEGDEQLRVLSLGADTAPLARSLADDDHTVVIYKGGRHLREVAELLAEHDRTEGAVVGELLGLPGGRSVPLSTVADQPSSYLATVVIPARRPDPPAGSGAVNDAVVARGSAR